MMIAWIVFASIGFVARHCNHVWPNSQVLKQSCSRHGVDSRGYTVPFYSVWFLDAWVAYLMFVELILLYSSEIWGYEDSSILERLHTDFLRRINNLRKSTPLYCLYAEYGRYPLNVLIKSRMINYWNRLVTGNQNKLSYQIYKYMLQMPNFESKWTKCIKQILTQVGRPDIWVNQNNIQTNTIKNQVQQTLIDQNLQVWHNSLQNSTKGLNYSIFKESIMLEPYMIDLKKSQYINLLKFRTGNHFFPCETGRWQNIHTSERTCFLCNMTDTADEFHYLLKCPFFVEERKKCLKKYYYTRPNVVKYKELLTTHSISQLSKLSSFVGTLLKVVKQ